MNFRFYYEKLLNSEEYKKFKKEHKNAYLSSCFFVLDLEGKGAGDKVNFDYWIPEFSKMYSFKLNGKIEFLNVENYDKRTPNEINSHYEFNLEDFKKMIEEKMMEEKIKGELKKILFSLQNLDGIDYFVITGFLSNMGLLKVNINLNENKITHFEKKSFFDMFKILKKN